jgi:predicted NACHT family NTPase
MSDAIKALAGNMVSRKREDVSPYILLLGAGASISSGCSGMVQIVDEVLQSRDTTQFEVWEREIESATSVEAEYGELKKEKIGQKKRDRFFEIWGRLDGESQYAILRQHLWEGKSPSNGYDDLAYLIKNGYFKMVLSTNLDNLLEKALRNKGWEAPDDFVVVVNGKDRPEEVREQLESSRPPFKFVKLHGTLESPGSYAFTPEEVNEFETAIKPPLSQIINQSLIVVGYSMQDRDIDVLFDEEGKEIHFVNPTTPEPESRIDIILKVRKLGDKIKDDDGTFDNFFQKFGPT